MVCGGCGIGFSSVVSISIGGVIGCRSTTVCAGVLGMVEDGMGLVCCVSV